MGLHNDIMNLNVDPYIETLPDNVRVAYKNGHKVARHTSAELSLKYERALEHALDTLDTIAKNGAGPEVEYCRATALIIRKTLEEN